MSDEIKEILEELEDCKATKYLNYNLDNKDARIILDYITNLQTIEREYSGLLSENAELQQENENLKDFNNKLQATKDRLDKYDKENQLEIDRLNNIMNELEDMIVVKLQRDYHEHDYRITTGDLEEIYNRFKKLKENNNE